MYDVTVKQLLIQHPAYHGGFTIIGVIYTYAGPAGVGVHYLASANVDTHMTYTSAAGVEEQVSGLGIGRRDLLAHCSLGSAVSGKVNPKLLKDTLYVA